MPTNKYDYLSPEQVLMSSPDALLPEALSPRPNLMLLPEQASEYLYFLGFTYVREYRGERQRILDQYNADLRLENNRLKKLGFRYVEEKHIPKEAFLVSKHQDQTVSSGAGQTTQITGHQQALVRPITVLRDVSRKKTNEQGTCCCVSSSSRLSVFKIASVLQWLGSVVTKTPKKNPKQPLRQRLKTTHCR